MLRRCTTHLTSRSRRRRLLAWAAGSLAVAVCVSCSAAPPTPADPDWTPPAWFAQQAQERDRVRAALQSCVTDKGWSIDVDERGGSEHGFESEQELDLFVADVDSCRDGIELNDTTLEDEASMRLFYERELDVYACLRNEGFTPPPPPPYEIFAESHQPDASVKDAWIAWGPWVGEQFTAGNLDDASLARLEQTCPQQW